MGVVVGFLVGLVSGCFCMCLVQARRAQQMQMEYEKRMEALKQQETEKSE